MFDANWNGIFKIRLKELTDMLISRSYNKNVVKAAIELKRQHLFDLSLDLIKIDRT